MANILELLDNRRRDLLEITENLTVEQLNTIPSGFNNNIVWNLGHILVVTDEILYKNTPFSIPTYDFDTSGFKKGTRPDNVITEKDISLIRSALSDTIPRFRKILNDLESARLQMSQSDTHHTLVDEKSLRFILFHEDMHFAKIQQLLSYVKQMVKTFR